MDFNVKKFNVRLRTIKIWELVIGIVLSVLALGIISLVFPEIGYDDNLLFSVLLFFLLLFFIFALRGTSGLKQNFSNVFEVKTRKEILYIFAINLLFAYIFTCIISGFDLLNGLLNPTWITSLEVETVDMTADVILLECIATIIFAPLLEELVFRGVLFNRLKIRTGIIPAMLISSALFAIGHDFGGITSAFLFGICMCILYLKTDNILVPISVHFTNNAVATLLTYTNIDFYLSQMPWLIPTTVLALIATVLLIRYIINELKVLKKSYK